MVGDTDFRLLGTLDVTVAGRAITVPAGRQQVVLAGLLLRGNQIVRVSELIDWLWDEETPDNAASTAQAYVRRLRQTLNAKDLITTMPHGYRINLAPDELDLFRFRSLVKQADETADPAARTDLITRALAQWRGPALADIPACSFREREVTRLTEEHLRATEIRVDCDLALGRHAQLLPELRNLTTQHPFRERLQSQLMVALYRSGRQVEALAQFQDVRARLADEFGVDPGEQLRQLHQRILTNDPALTLPSKPRPAEAADVPAVAAVPAQRPVPRQLPAGLRDFVGREETYEQIVTLLSGDAGTGVPVVAISGQPGVGKSALAVQVAHHLRARFPDGQLFVDLLGNALDRELTAEQVLARFLQALGLPPDQLPDDLNGLVGAYRTALADRNVLVVLDNAASAGQVRNLLPTTPGSGALVTSRRPLRGLAVLGGAQLVNLDVLDTEQSIALLNTIVGHDRLHDPDALGEVAELCGHLPLALRIAGANLLLRDDDSAQAYVTDLRHGNRLTALEIEDDPGATVRAVFDLSYLALKPEVARLFRQLSLVPGPDFSREAVAVLGRLSQQRADKLLAELVVAGLIQQTAADRFRFHDLLRLYSAERCQIEENPGETEAARARLFAYYVRWLDAVADVLWRTWSRLPRTEVELAVPSPTFDHQAPAFAWMDQEGPNVIAAILDAAEHGPVHAAWHLVESLCAYLVTRGRYRAEGFIAARAALQAAQAAGDAHAEAAMHYVHASISYRVQEHAAAMAHTLAELEAYDRCESHEGRARALVSLGILYQADGKLRAAAEQVEKGVRLAEEHGFDAVRLFGLINLSVIEEQRGHLDRAEWSAYEALKMAPASGNPVTEAASRVCLGHVMVRQGRFGDAIGQYTAALARYRETGTRHYVAETLRGLANANTLTGDHQAALAHAHEALAVAEESGIDQDQVDSLVTLAAAHQGMGHTDEAATCARNALEMSRGLGYRRGEIVALLELASQCRQRGDLSTAGEHARHGAELSRRAELVGFEGRSETFLAWLAFEARDLIVARDHAQRALAVYVNAGSPFGQAQALHVLGLSFAAGGDHERARSCWEQALDRLAGLAIPETDELRRLLAPT
ncbi:BTAD domain-containing putative transcriptional regulator [Kibdelosporangium persicum]|uniref:DNA-binding transcriptional activator of the SARP family n=1 Tax=Kibdelosporangium persicum TaxID=2698649 RepID=A0ABX2F1N0_9PSEU|nr:BTAD domain-containing putative transcriptional regulator [Kibdelosporangium persicum]NRN65202.1 DNA-binding transcriptional activator of the SARP family [Kibdelosporangium persicum]